MLIYYVKIWAIIILIILKKNQQISHYIPKKQIIFLEETQPEYSLYLAIRKTTYGTIFSEAIGQLIIQKYQLNLIICDPKKEEILQWISWINIEILLLIN